MKIHSGLFVWSLKQQMVESRDAVNIQHLCVAVCASFTEPYHNTGRDIVTQFFHFTRLGHLSWQWADSLETCSRPPKEIPGWITWKRLSSLSAAEIMKTKLLFFFHTRTEQKCFAAQENCTLTSNRPVQYLWHWRCFVHLHIRSYAHFTQKNH